MKLTQGVAVAVSPFGLERRALLTIMDAYAFLGFGVSMRNVPQRLKPEAFIELYRRSKDLLHPVWDTVKPKKV